MYINNIKLLFVFFLAITFGNESYSQADGSSIKFKSDFEKEVLTNLDKHSSLEILLSISENSSRKR